MTYIERDRNTPRPTPRETKPGELPARWAITYRIEPLDVPNQEPLVHFAATSDQLLDHLDHLLHLGCVDIRVWGATEWSSETRVRTGPGGQTKHSWITLDGQTYSRDELGKWQAWRGGPNDR